MANSTIASLPAITNPAITDILYLVHNPGGTPVDQSVTLSAVQNSLTIFPVLAPGSDTANKIALSADWKGLVIQGSGSQTKPLQEWLPNSGSQYIRIGSNADRILLQTNAGIGSHIIAANDNIFSLTADPTIYFGYNQLSNGTNFVAAENALSYGIEGNYNDGSGHNKMESYLQYLSADGTFYLRPIFWQFRRDNDTLTAAQFMGAPFQILTPPVKGGAASTNMYDFANNAITMYAPISATTSINMKAATSNVSLIQMGYNAVDAVLEISTNTRNIHSILVDTATSGPSSPSVIMWLFGRGAGGAEAAISIGVQDNGAAATLKPTLTSQKGLVVRAVGSQSVNQFEIQDSSSNPLITVNPAGVFFPVQAPTASAPAYTKGGVYFDTTLNKLRIGGVSAWETVTSA